MRELQASAEALERITAASKQAYDSGKTAGIGIGLMRAASAINALRIPEIAAHPNPAGNSESTEKEPGTTDTTKRLRVTSTPEGRADTSEQVLDRQVATARRDTGSIPPSQQRVIDAIAWWSAIGVSPVSRQRASIIAGLSPKASTFGVYISKLAAAGLVDTAQAGAVALTDAGLSAATDPGRVDRKQVVAQARSMLQPAAAGVFDRIVAVHPAWISRGDLADACGLSRTASTLGVYISKCSSLGFVDTETGKVRAADWLFPQLTR